MQRSTKLDKAPASHFLSQFEDYQGSGKAKLTSCFLRVKMSRKQNTQTVQILALHAKAQQELGPGVLASGAREALVLLEGGANSKQCYHHPKVWLTYWFDRLHPPDFV